MFEIIGPIYIIVIYNEYFPLLYAIESIDKNNNISFLVEYVLIYVNLRSRLQMVTCSGNCNVGSYIGSNNLHSSQFLQL